MNTLILLLIIIQSKSCKNHFTLVAPIFFQVAMGQKDGAPVADSISCFTCGLEDVDPEMDVKGSYGDARKDGTPEGKKMYNHTCDIADEMGLDDKWVRKCPAGVKSCFWAQGRYDSQSKT